MKAITKLWTKMNDCLTDVGNTEEFTKEVYNKFDEIFNLKEVAEYKAAAITDVHSPSQFAHTTTVMKRALVEGYLLAQMEQRQADIKTLYNMYRKNIKEELDAQDNIKDKYAFLSNHSNEHTGFMGRRSGRS